MGRCRKLRLNRATEIWRAFSLFVLVAIAFVSAAPEVQAQECTGPGTGAQPFTFLQSGLSQRLFATSRIPYSAVAFAPNGDLWWGNGPNVFFPNNASYLARRLSSATPGATEAIGIDPEATLRKRVCEILDRKHHYAPAVEQFLRRLGWDGKIK